jgi:short-subunit dehydrogenase
MMLGEMMGAGFTLPVIIPLADHDWRVALGLWSVPVIVISSFMPGPLLTVYYATKAYVASFSQAIAEEVASNNISVTALCLGPVATGFVAAADLGGVAVFDQSKTAESVARCGYKAMMRGELVAFNETKLKFLLNWVVPIFTTQVSVEGVAQSDGEELTPNVKQVGTRS